MNIRRVTMALVIALLVSGLCTYALSRKVGAGRNQAPPLLKYVGLARSLQAGEILKLNNVTLVSWPATNPVAGAFTKPEEIFGRTLLYPMDAGQPITEKFVSAAGAGVGLAGRIPAGMRALALRSDEVMGVAGFLSPGSHVDVFVTFRSDRSPEPVTATVLQDAEVVAAGQKIQPDPEGKPATVTVVTLLLTPQDAERAVLASTQGTIHFVLRGGSDKGRVEDSPIMMSQLSHEFTNIRSLPHTPIHRPRSIGAPPTHAAPPTYVVETILGDKQSSSSFVAGGKR